METHFPTHKTRIVATIGPASQSAERMRGLLRAGLNVARINLSHGRLDEHAGVIARLREVAAEGGHRLAIMADLPGPKIRIGDLEQEPVMLESGAEFSLTTEPTLSNEQRVWVDFAPLPGAVKPGDPLFINDGLIHLKVLNVVGPEVRCKVVVGGELRSRKGLNLPGADLGSSCFTERDRECVRFAAEQQLDAISQSFVSTAEDLQEVRSFTAELGYEPFLIAKIERLGALDHIDRILKECDGIMVARGDLGVEIPIERIAVVQKHLIEKARKAGKPVITATQMLESMVSSRRPTRAEATDVANAILDGTDAVMLSAESAVGAFPVESVQMLAAIAGATEPERDDCRISQNLKKLNRRSGLTPVDLIALNIRDTLKRSDSSIVLAPTGSGRTARNITRFRLPVWTVAFSASEKTCQQLQFSYGVMPVCVEEDLEEWDSFGRSWLRSRGLDKGIAVLAQGPRNNNLSNGYRFELLDLGCCD